MHLGFGYGFITSFTSLEKFFYVISCKINQYMPPFRCYDIRIACFLIQGPKGAPGKPGAAGEAGLPGLPGVDVSILSSSLSVNISYRHRCCPKVSHQLSTVSMGEAKWVLALHVLRIRRNVKSLELNKQHENNYVIYNC